MRIGIDIGGSHVGIGVVDDNGSILEKEEMYIKDRINIEDRIENFIIEKVNNMMVKHQIERIGIASPGTISKRIIVKSVNLGFKNYDLANKLEKVFQIPVNIKNDAKCAALAEYKYGEMANYEDCVFLCIGTGIGTAVIYDGKLLEPNNTPGFEISHTIIQKDGELCNCGKRGCLETYVSLKRFKQRISDRFDLNTLNGEKIRKFIEENKENQLIKEMIKEYIDYLSVGISNIINVFEPEAICIGGSFSEYGDIFMAPLKETLLTGNLLFNSREDFTIKYAKLKNDAGIIGAALI